MRILPKEPLFRLQARFAKLYGDSAASQLIQRLYILLGHYGYDAITEPDSSVSLWDQSDSLLITYGDMVKTPGEKPLVTLSHFLKQYLNGVISAVHILPFWPYSSDEGFSVIDYRQVDENLGDWNDIESTGDHFDLMFDLVLNHVSRKSTWFQHFVNGKAPARDYFIVMDPETDLSTVVRPRTSPLLSPTQTPYGELNVWTTFSADQVDLNFSNPDVLFEFLDILLLYLSHGARIIRLDAIAYLWKQPGTTCVNLPETHEVVKILRDVLDIVDAGALLLTETNLPHEQNISYFGDGDESHMVYQFSLPPLLLHALHTGQTQYLTEWAASLPKVPRGCTFLNFTASHDGIGLRPLEGLIPTAEFDELVKTVEQRGGYVSSRTDNVTGKASPYELNITYFDALSDPGQTVTDRHIDRFVCSQTVMLSLKGIPAVYFHSLTATQNDHWGVDLSGRYRSINRKRWDDQELKRLLNDPKTVNNRVFSQYVKLLKIRSGCPAFHPDGAQRVLELENGLFGIVRTSPNGLQELACISNMSSESKDLQLDKVLPNWNNLSATYPCQDLIQDRRIERSDISLRPYQSVWLRASKEKSRSYRAT